MRGRFRRRERRRESSLQTRRLTSPQPTDRNSRRDRRSWKKKSERQRWRVRDTAVCACACVFMNRCVWEKLSAMNPVVYRINKAMLCVCV